MYTFLLLSLLCSTLILSHASPISQMHEQQVLDAKEPMSNRVKRWGGWGGGWGGGCCGGGFGYPMGFGNSWGSSYGMSSSYSMNAYNSGYNYGFGK